MIKRLVTYVNENTLVPIGMAFSVIGGGAAWLTTLHIESASNASTLKEIQEKQDTYQKDIQEIKINIAEIKGDVKHLRGK